MGVLNFSCKRGQNEIHSDFAEREKIQGLKNLNVPNLRFVGYTDEWELKELQNIATLSKGSGISKEQLSENGTPCILYGELYTKYKSEIISEVYSKTELDTSNLVESIENDVIIPCSGETAIDISTARCVPFNGILLGGDLNIIRLKNHNGVFFAYQLNGKRKVDIAKVAQGVSVVHLYGEHLKRVKVSYPTYSEQTKIASFLSLLDERIATQSKIIEDLKKLKVAIIENAFCGKHYNYKIGDIITQISNRNKSNKETNVLSVSNKLGFVEQSEQFEDRTVASEDVTNYKIVRTNDFAYNPARINVGSIARLKQYESGIVSPMYICFHAKKNVLPEYLEMFFLTQYFKHEMYKRLEGSVRLCLSFEGLTNIPISIPEIPLQKEISEKILAFETKIGIEEHYLNALEKQKQYLLQQMFI